MAVRLTLVQGGVDLKLIESFLLSHNAVLDASVWVSNGNIMAHVTVLDDDTVDPAYLKAACAKHLGVHQTPTEILLMAARQKAA
jgi:hypothetical protein